jgi:hypothetical protein
MCYTESIRWLLESLTEGLTRSVATPRRGGYSTQVLCDTIEIDDDLFAAQDSRKLAVFVGAGVSIAAPSSLPSFEQLVELIRKDVPHLDAPANLPFDARLGRLAAQGVNVHEICRRIIAQSAKPNELHSAILSLFPDPSDIRIITTNFDPHFTTSSQNLGRQVPIYRAPALPLGGDFRGIVHLHGSILEPARMVLTEGDFGAAYMTDGYAARFLRDLFAIYTVLFIGYSHSDPPMNYFNQGLGARRRRHFILTHEDKPDDWRRLRLAPLLYVASGNDHSKLELALSDWAEQTSMRPTEIAARLQEILANPRVISRSQEGFLLRHHCREHTVGAFVEHAQLFDWVRWMHGKGLILPLLKNSAPIGVEGLLSHWLGQMFARDESGIGLGIVEECGGILNNSSAHGLLVTILRAIEKTSVTNAQKHWLWLLLRQSPSIYLGVYASVISALARWDEWELALQFVTFLVTPTIRPQTDGRPNPHFIGSGPFPSLIADHYDLTQSFDAIGVIAAKDSVRQPELLTVLERACRKLGEQCAILGLDNHHRPGLVSFDSILTADRYHTDALGALIAFTCRFALDLSSAAKLNKEILSRWMDSKNPILIRCALLCMEKSPLPPSAILDLLVNHDGLYPLAFFPDPERDAAIHSIFPRLTEAEKRTLLVAMRRGPSTEWEKGAPDE